MFSLLFVSLNNAQACDLETYNKIKDFEGYRAVAYDDVGVWSIGFGSRSKENEKINIVQGYFRYTLDFMSACEAATKQTDELNLEYLDGVFTNINYQLGENWYKEHKKTWKLFKEGKVVEAANEMKNSKWFKQTPKRVLYNINKIIDLSQNN